MTSDHQTPLDAALDYAKIGWPVFPCRPNKKPWTEHGHKDASLDPDQIHRWWQRWPDAHVGVACGPAGICVLDGDIKPPKDGVAFFTRLADQNFGHQCNLIAGTPRGGRHYFYLRSEPVSSCSDVVAGSGLDVRSDGGYVVVPSPASPDRGWAVGDPFDVGDGGTVDIGPMPAWVLELVTRRRKLTMTPQGAIPQLARDRIEVASALYAIPPDVSRSDWLSAIFAVHAKCDGSEYGAKLVEGWSSMSEAVTGDGSPQYRPGEAAKIYHGSALPENSPDRALIDGGTLFAMARSFGWRAAGLEDDVDIEGLFREAEEATPRAAASTEPASAVAERWAPIRSLDVLPTAPRWLFRLPTRDGKPAAPGCGDGFLRRGRVASLVGAGGSGKTHVLLNAAIAVATESRWLGYFPSSGHGGKVLALLGEEDHDEAHRRIYHATRDLDPEDRRLIEQRLIVVPMMGRRCGLLRRGKNGPEIAQPLRDVVALLRRDAGPEGWALVILDPLSRLAGLPLDVDNDNATAIVQVAEQIAEEAGSPAVLLGIHSSKASRRKGERVEVRGPSGLTDGVRAELHLYRDEDGRVYLHAAKNNYAPFMKFPGVQLEVGKGGTLCASACPIGEDNTKATKAAATAAVIEALVNALEQAGSSDSIDAVCLRAQVSAPRVGRSAFKMAVENGRIKNVGTTRSPRYEVPRVCGGDPPYPPADVGDVRGLGAAPTSLPFMDAEDVGDAEGQQSMNGAKNNE